MARSKKLVLLALLAIGTMILPGCGDDVSAPTDPGVPTVTLTQLQTAPETFDLPQQSYRLETYLWRDFMPISPPDGRPLVAVVRLLEENQEPIPANVSLAYLWVINGGRVWSTALSECLETPDYSLECYAYNGPKWGPENSVDVVVGVRVGGALRLVRLAAQPIFRTV